MNRWKPSPIWSKALNASADPQRAKHFLHLLSDALGSGTLPKFPAEQARILAALFAGSEALSNSLIVHPQWLNLIEPETLKFPRRKQGLASEANRSLQPLIRTREYESAFKFVREFKQREMLRIGARDLARLSNAIEITRELSDLADVCLASVWAICSKRLSEKLGKPFHQDAQGRWRETQGCVLGMGKLGGEELNYSSDVDVLFVYEEEGKVHLGRPSSTLGDRRGVTNHQFYCRLSESFIAEVSRMAPEGMLYRIDLRLRPEGKMGPLARSLASYENYYAQWGQTWERMMMIKARGVAGDEALAGEFLEMIHAFRYPRSISQDVLREVAAMKDRIENEVVKEGELERNVKLGRGGIREIEFVVQSQQLLHAGRQPFLQSSQTVPCLEKLAQYELLEPDDASELREAYCFLRDVEHRLQIEGNLQTHTIPAEHKARERLAGLMGFKSLKAFEDAHQRHRTAVRRIFHKVLRSEGIEGERAFPEQFEGAEGEWKGWLQQHGFRDPEKAFRVLREFVEGPGYVHVSPRTREMAMKLLPRVLVQSPKSKVQGPGKCQVSGVKGREEWEVSAGKRKAEQDRERARERKKASSPRPSAPEGERGKARPGSADDTRHLTLVRLSDPDRVVTRLDSFIAAYGARGTLFELWSSNPTIFDLLVLLFDRSEFLAELAIRTPDLVDELVMSGRLRQRKTSAETLQDLRHGINDADQHAWLRKYHQAELMRIGLRDILGLADEEQYLVELSALADACLQYAVEVVLRKYELNELNRLNKGKAARRLSRSPELSKFNELNQEAPFAIIGLGKLGGAEIDYGSDLDILFVAGSTEGVKKAASNRRDAKERQANPLLTSAATIRMAAEVMDLLSRRTEDGIVFHTDARLRPDGEKGLLINTLEAYEEYYRQRAALWEIQSLTRTRLVAGNVEIGARFQEMAAELTNFREFDSLTTGREETSNFKLQTSEKLQGSNLKTRTRTSGHAGARVDAGEMEGGRKGLPAAFTPKWKQEIHRMRMRIEKERTPAGKDDLAIKTGKGGLMDAEFVAQVLCLENGWQEANTLRALERATNLKLETLNFRETSKTKTQSASSCVKGSMEDRKPNLLRQKHYRDQEVQSSVARGPRSVVPGLENLIAAYRKLRRVEGILRRWSYEGETVLPDDPAPYYRVAVRCGFETAEEFRRALAEWRKEIREGYETIMTRTNKRGT